MKQERLCITHEELAELQVERFEEGRDAKQVRGDFGHLRHKASKKMEGGMVPGRPERFN